MALPYIQSDEYSIVSLFPFDEGVYPRFEICLLINKHWTTRQEIGWNELFMRFGTPVYRDESGDLITLATAREMRDAIAEADENHRVLRIEFRGRNRPLFLHQVMMELKSLSPWKHILLGSSTPGSFDLEVDMKTGVVSSRTMDLPDRLAQFIAEANIPQPAFSPHAIQRFMYGQSGSRQIPHQVAPVPPTSLGHLPSTPVESSPPSPRLEPFANNDTPLLNFPPLQPTPATIPPPTEEEAEDPPDAPPSEEEFPNPPFPGAFPTDTDDNLPANFTGLSESLSSTFQSTIDSLARLSHVTLTAAQNAAQRTGFPLPANDDTHRSMDANLENARANLTQGLGTARTNLANGIENARMGLANVGQAWEQAIRNGAFSQGATERLVRDIRRAGDRMERVVENCTLRIQREIDRRSRLPGSFPVDTTNANGEREEGVRREMEIKECADRLIEMGFFSEEQRDSALAVSVAVEGKLEDAVELIEG
jgi:hypothetical protein